MPQDSLIYGVAMVRSHEAGLIDEESMDKLVQLDSKSAMRFLSEKGYGGGEELPIDSFERLIEAELKKTYELINEITPDKRQTDIFLLAGDMHNLKMLLKLKCLNSSDEAVLSDGGIIDRKTVRAMVDSGDYYGLPESIAEGIKSAAEKFEQDKDPVRFSVAVDELYCSYAIKNGSAFVKEYFTAKADFDNLLTLLRARRMGRDRGFINGALLSEGSIDKSVFLDCMDVSVELLADKLVPDGCARAMREGLAEAAKTGKLYPIERERDNYLISLARRGKGEFADIAPIIGYLLAREQEAKCLRLILTLKRNGISEDIIKERLGELYG